MLHSRLMALHPTPRLETNRDPARALPWPGARFTGYLVALTVLLCLPRFAHTTPDSVYYTDLVAYFRGELDRGQLQTPFAFRWVAPWLASWLPATPRVGMGLCSVVSTAAAYLILVRLSAHFLVTRAQLPLAGAVLVLSFPTVNYGSAVLTDAAGFLVLAAASLAMVRGRFLLLALVLVAGTGVRESTLLMLPALWLFVALSRDRRAALWAVAVSLATLLAAAGHRWYFADLPPYIWIPSWNRFAANMARLESWITVALTTAPLLIGLALGHGAPPIPRRLRAFAMSVALPTLLLFGYATLSAYLSGRFCWPLYIALAPVVAWRLSHSPIRTVAGIRTWCAKVG